MVTTDTPIETPEQKAKREAEARRLELEKQAQESARAEDGGILGAIMGFLKFLFEIFFPNKEAPDEAPEQPTQPNAPESPSQVSRIGRLIIDAKAIPKWAEFQREHKGDAVTHSSPVASDTQVTSGFGNRIHPIKKVEAFHAGVDLGARGGSANPDIVASEKGVILFSGDKSGYGRTVIVGHSDGSYTLYGHLTGAKMPSVGDEVKQGQTIGVMGSTGGSTGIHLHYEQRKGTEARAPQIAGIEVKNGMKVAAAPAAGDHVYAALVDRAAHPKLPTDQSASASSPSFTSGASVKAGAAQVRGG